MYDKVEEAKHLWELAVTLVAALAMNAVVGGEARTSGGLMKDACAAERDAFRNWQAVSRENGA